MRAAAGLATGAVLAVAGVFFAESRPEATKTAFVLKYLLPLAAFGLFQITGTFWVFPSAAAGRRHSLAVGIALHLGGGGPEREAQQKPVLVGEPPGRGDGGDRGGGLRHHCRRDGRASTGRCRCCSGWKRATCSIAGCCRLPGCS